MKSIMVALIFTFLVPVNFFAEENIIDVYPHAILSNGIIETAVFLPDTEKGFYRSSRYDWSSMIGQLTYKKHTFFMIRKHQIPHDPVNTGHAIGLAEEYSSGLDVLPVRYDEAKPGETFMKIGVGLLRKPDDGKYMFGKSYTIVDHGTWKVRRGKNWIEFTHTISDSYGYGYKLVKKIELPEGKPEIIIYHSLANTGRKSIKADQYCHNFFIFDSQEIDSDYEVELPFKPEFENDLTGIAEIRGPVITVLGKQDRGLYSPLKGYSNDVGHNHAVIRHKKIGVRVGITGDFSLSRFNFYADISSICPELFVGLSIGPGETQSWKRVYTFFAK